jgi:multiple sugar transport system permease protein
MTTSAARRHRGKALTPYLLLLPGLLFVLGVLGYGVVSGAVMSFFEVDAFLNRRFVGLANYVAVFSRPRFQASLWRTLWFVVYSIGLGLLLAMVFALTLDRVTRGRQFLRGLSLVPYFVSGIATAVMWRFMFSSNVGLVNRLLEAVGLPSLSWLGNPTLSFAVCVLANTWFIAPFATLLLLSGLQTIDRQLFDAARIDGASGLAVFRFITLPMIKPMVGVSLIWLSYASFSMFDIIVALTGGGPFRATEVVSLYMYQVGFRFLDFGEASVLMLVLLGINTLMSLLYLKLFVIGGSEA